MGRIVALVIALMVSLGPLAQAAAPIQWVLEEAELLGAPPHHSALLEQAPYEALSNIDGYFTENLGQKGEGAGRFYCQGLPLSVAFDVGRVAYDHRPEGEVAGAMFRVTFDGANPVGPVGVDPLPHRSNYFIGNDPEGWVTGARNYREVMYPALYDGIDLRFHFAEGRLKYEFIVSPGMDPNMIGMTFEGIQDLSLDEGSGDLLISTAVGILRDQAPRSFIEGTEMVESEYVLRGTDSVGFRIDPFDETRELVIDPGLEFSTYVGGSSWEAFRENRGQNMDVDDDGNVYVGGRTNSVDFPISPGAYDRVHNRTDSFVFKLNASGDKLLYATFMGCSDAQSEMYCIDVDDNGVAYMGFDTFGPDFPTTPGAMIKNATRGQNPVIVKLSADGSSLLYSTYLTTNRWNQPTSIHINDDGTVYVLGSTNNPNFPTGLGAHQNTTKGVSDAFIIKLAADGGSLPRGTLYGGSEGDQCFGLAVSDEGNIYIGGFTWSTDLKMTANSYQSNQGGDLDGFVAKFDENLTSLLASTYIGGSGEDGGVRSLSLNNDGEVVAAGCTASNDFPTTADAWSTRLKGGHDTFIVRFDSDLESLDYGTYFGGSGSENWEHGMFHTDKGELLMVGSTSSNDLPVTNDAHDRGLSGPTDVFVVRFDDADDVKYLSYLGGSDNEGTTMTLHHDGNTTIIGITQSSDFPTTAGAFCTTDPGSDDIFVTRMWTGDPPDATPPTPPRNLTAAVNETRVLLTWEPPEDPGGSTLRGYNVYRGDSEANLSKLNRPAIHNSYDDSPTPDGSTYYYAVSGYNVNEGNLSNIVNVTVFGSPRIPGDFASTPGCNTVTLTWIPPDETGGLPILGYGIYRGTFSTGLERLVDLDNVTSHIDADVVNGRTYLYQICAFTEYGDGPRSGMITARPVGGPGIPFDVKTISIGNGTVTIEWTVPLNNGGMDILGYKISRGFTAEGLFQHETIERETDRFTDTGLENSVTYYYAVQAYNILGDSPRSMVVNATPYGLPDPPDSPVAIEGDGQIILHWGRPVYNGGDPVAVYIIYRGTSEDTIEAWDGTIYRMYIDYNVSNGESYYYRIASSNTAGIGDWTDVLYAVPHSLPETPRDFGIEVGNRYIEITWVRPSSDGGVPILNYTIYRGETPDDLEPYRVVNHTNVPTFRFIDTDVDDGQTYYYMITANTRGGEGPATDIISGLAFGPPGPPMDVNATAGDGQVQLVWSAPALDGGRPVLGYIIYRGDTPDPLFEVARSFVLSYTDDNVENDRTYYYRVSALNSIDDGPQSDIVNASPRRSLTVPGLPGSLKAQPVDNDIELTWLYPMDTGGSPITGYIIKRGLTPSEMEVYAEVGVGQEYLDADLLRDKTYWYSIAAKNDIGRGAFSPVVQAEIEGHTETVSDGVPWLLLIVITVIVIMTVGATSVTESGRYRWGLLFGPLTTRLKRDEVLDNKTRHALLGIIITHPGIHYQAIMREFDLKNGMAAYHLNVLEREEYIRSVRDGRLKRFYSTDTKVPEDQRMTPVEVREAIVDLVASQPGISQKRIVNELAIDGETVRYHLRVLLKQKELRSAREGKHAVYYRDT